MSDSATPSEVRCVLLPLQQEQLLLPNAAVCEVVGYREPEQLIENSPAWLLGRLAWREHLIPLVSFEQLVGREAAPAGHRARVAICNTYSGNERLPYMGIVLKSAPHLIRVDEESITPLDRDELTGSCVMSQLMIEDEPAMIPDLLVIERELAPFI